MTASDYFDAESRTVFRFDGQWRFLSNFFPTPHMGTGTTLEHHFQAAKTTDPEQQEQILRAPTAGLAKRLGRRVTLRPDWEQIKVRVMRDLLFEKFDSHDYAGLLLSTGDLVLVEGNYWHDNTWGSCFCGSRPGCAGQGENLLGRLLMELRAELRAADRIRDALCQGGEEQHDRHVAVCLQAGHIAHQLAAAGLLVLPHTDPTYHLPRGNA